MRGQVLFSQVPSRRLSENKIWLAEGPRGERSWQEAHASELQTEEQDVAEAFRAQQGTDTWAS